jgi:hypothetical protein
MSKVPTLSLKGSKSHKAKLFCLQSVAAASVRTRLWQLCCLFHVCLSNLSRTLGSELAAKGVRTSVVATEFTEKNADAHDYFPDWGGNLFAVEKDSGRLIWSHKISDYDGVAGAFSRVSPAVDGEQLIIGEILNSKRVHNGRPLRRSR